MTIKEFKNSKEYADMVEKIKSYSVGFVFTIPYYKMTQKQINGMNIVTLDCIKSGILESLSIGLDIHGNPTEEKFKRI